MLEPLRRAFEEAGERALFVGSEGTMSYAAWLRAVASAPVEPVRSGDVVACRVATSAAFVAAFWALLERGAIVCLVGPADDLAARGTLVGADWLCDGAGPPVRGDAPAVRHPLYLALASSGRPGIVLLTSGSTGVPKVAVHDACRLLGKFTSRGRDLRTLLFLPLEHIGGLDTLLYAMSNGSTVVLPDTRSVEHVCAAIAAHRAEVLATNPSFLNLLLLQDAPRRWDLSSLQIVTYGAEVMPQVTLDRMRAAFPELKLLQKYGSTELGALRTRSRGDGSLWIKWDGDVQARVVDGRLEVKTATTMLGYLNAASDISPDGWVATGDMVLQDGEYFRVVGRASELINVGGEKVYPSEIEEVLLQLDGVRDAVAYAESNALLGQVVAVQLVYDGPARGAELTALVRRHCMARLAAYKVPMRVRAVDALAHGPQKKLRPGVHG